MVLKVKKAVNTAKMHVLVEKQTYGSFAAMPKPLKWFQPQIKRENSKRQHNSVPSPSRKLNAWEQNDNRRFVPGVMRGGIKCD